jgi:hypothetical protein
MVGKFKVGLGMDEKGIFEKGIFGDDETIPNGRIACSWKGGVGGSCDSLGH